ncbi:hypothetical protein [Campylobacter corcagiensis]|uniref:Uncharacterized protein n=1 Tax=Campylobacter corcagiensis TaxID=1448857 RepID=A0A7M1LFA3_9BACT|nr:hypothetical protein [Campylobacter corcagiensis]QKF64553.1 hypothetical protein CCORG_0692 [Campylobacter corcagiensis]QOQ87272.1 hypothetical protein IMC76_08710 [Campylobacter corcagiensis]
MYVEGSCNGMFELLEVIKTTAISVGWKLQKEVSLPFNKVYDNESFINTNPFLVDGLATTKGKENFINLPRKESISGINFDEDAEVSVYGVLEDNTEVLIKDKISSSTTFAPSDKFNRYKVTSSKDLSEINLVINSDKTLQKEIYLQSSGSSEMEQICVNFKAFLVPSDYTNLMCSVALSFSGELGFKDQVGGVISNLAGLDSEIKYFLNIDKNKIIVAIRVYDQNDAYLKSPLYQIGYFGKLRIYGGEWSFTSNFASIAGSYDLLTRFSDIKKSCLENPKLSINQSVVTPTTNIINWSKDSLDISPYPNGELFSTPVFYYKKNTQNITGQNTEDYFNGEIYGELDGIVKIVATAGVNSEDCISINGSEYVVIQDGSENSAYNLFAIKKD